MAFAGVKMGLGGPSTWPALLLRERAGEAGYTGVAPPLREVRGEDAMGVRGGKLAEGKGGWSAGWTAVLIVLGRRNAMLLYAAAAKKQFTVCNRRMIRSLGERLFDERKRHDRREHMGEAYSTKAPPQQAGGWKPAAEHGGGGGGGNSVCAGLKRKPRGEAGGICNCHRRRGEVYCSFGLPPKLLPYQVCFIIY